MSEKPDFSYIDGKLSLFNKEIKKGFFSKNDTKFLIDIERLVTMNREIISVFITEDTFIDLFKQGFFTDDELLAIKSFDKDIALMSKYVHGLHGAKRIHIFKKFIGFRRSGITFSISKTYEYNAFNLKGNVILKF